MTRKSGPARPGTNKLPPRAEQTRFTGNRSPDRSIELAEPLAPADRARADGRATDAGADTAPEALAPSMRVRRSRLGVCQIETGFELSSQSAPSVYQANPANPAAEGPLADRLALDLRAALLPLLERLPNGASFSTEYHLRPQPDGMLELRILVLVETRPAVEEEALAQALALRSELAMALGLLAPWYGFADADINSAALARSKSRVLRLLPSSFTLATGEGIGFVRKGATTPQVSVPAIAGDKGRPHSLWFADLWRPGLTRALRAAHALPQSAVLRISVRRDTLTEDQRGLLARALSDTRVDESRALADASGPVLPAQQQRVALAEFLDAFATQQGITRLEMEFAADGPIPEVFLRLTANEIFPCSSVQIIEPGAARGARQRSADLGNGLDLSCALCYPEWVPPLLPDPWTLDALAFPRHINNINVQLPSSGLELGYVTQSGFERPVRFGHADRSRHMYVLGATGTGKSTLILNLARQDIEAGRGVAVMDPHGDLFDQLLETIPKDRIDDVVIIDPSDANNPVGMNPMLLGEQPTERQRNRLCNDLYDMLIELYPELREWGARFSQFFRNAMLLVLSTEPEPSFESLVNLFATGRFGTAEAYRTQLLANCPYQQVRTFFDMAGKTVGENHYDNWGPSVTSKFANFVDNPVLRAMMCSPQRKIDFRELIDKKRILLVNLAKGDIGAQDARMVGMLITNALFEAALSRHDMAPSRRAPYYFYLDEFQNFTTRAIADILAEARKYGLHLILAHQTIGQLIDRSLSPPTKLVDAVLGNIATKLFMRVGLDEARMLEAQFQPQFNAQTLAQLPDRRVIGRLLVNNKPSEPFVFSTLPPRKPLQTRASRTQVLASSRQRYGVEAVGSGAQLGRPAQSPYVADVPTDPQGIGRLRRLAARARNAVPPKPEAGRLYRTLNNSIVFVLSVDRDGDARTIVLRGGHGQTDKRGDTPLGEPYWINASGQYMKQDDTPVSVIGMSLSEVIPVQWSAPPGCPYGNPHQGGLRMEHDPLADLHALVMGAISGNKPSAAIANTLFWTLGGKVVMLGAPSGERFPAKLLGDGAPVAHALNYLPDGRLLLSGNGAAAMAGENTWIAAGLNLGWPVLLRMADENGDVVGDAFDLMQD